jgi:hypothetical protein
VIERAVAVHRRIGPERHADQDGKEEGRHAELDRGRQALGDQVARVEIGIGEARPKHTAREVAEK